MRKHTIGFIGLGAVVETAYLPALRRLGDVIDRCQGYDLDCSRALPGIQRCSSLSALLAEPLDTLFITTSSLQHLPVLERALASGISRIVVEKPIVNDSVDRVTLCEDRLVLAGEPDGVWMVREHGSGVRYYTDLYFKTAQVVPARTMEVSSNAAIVAALSAGFGQSLISEAAVPAGVPVQRELGDEFVRRFYALVPRSGLTHDQRELAETIIAALRG